MFGAIFNDSLEGVDGEVAHKVKGRLIGELNRVLIQSEMKEEDLELAPMPGLREAPLGVIEE